jgi:hypothetical protein
VRAAFRTVLALLAGLAFAAALAAGAFGLVATLERPSADAVLGTRILRALQHHRGFRSVVSIAPGTALTGTCRSVSQGRSLVTLSNGERLLVVGERVRALDSSLSGYGLLAAADLAGCPKLLGLLLRRRVLHSFMEGQTWSSPRPGRYNGRSVYVIPLKRRRPSVKLLIDQRTLAPLAVVFSSPALRGLSAIRSSLPRLHVDRPDDCAAYHGAVVTPRRLTASAGTGLDPPMSRLTGGCAIVNLRVPTLGLTPRADNSP